MSVNDDDRTVAAMDVLASGIGEIIGGSQREERFDLLDESVAERSLLKSTFTERESDHAAAPTGFARAMRSRSRGLLIASHKSRRRCTLSQQSGMLPNTRARITRSPPSHCGGCCTAR